MVKRVATVPLAIVSVDTASSLPYYRQLYEQLRQALYRALIGVRGTITLQVRLVPVLPLDCSSKAGS